MVEYDTRAEQVTGAKPDWRFELFENAPGASRHRFGLAQLLSLGACIMGVATKRRRKITVKDHQYLWCVAEDDDGAGMVLQVISTDKHFIAKYQIDQPKGEDYIVILGRRFAGAKTSGPWRRFFCPHFVAHAVTPQSVRELIEWCLDESLTRQEIGWRSRSLSL